MSVPSSSYRVSTSRPLLSRAHGAAKVAGRPSVSAGSAMTICPSDSVSGPIPTAPLPSSGTARSLEGRRTGRALGTKRPLYVADNSADGRIIGQDAGWRGGHGDQRGGEEATKSQEVPSWTAFAANAVPVHQPQGRADRFLTTVRPPID